jgi:pilus assembly protein CpaB
MKNAKALGMLVLSMILGLVVTAYAVDWVSRKGTIESNKVVVASSDIELGSKLNLQMLTTVDWPSGSVPQGAFTELKDLQDRVVRISVQRGEAVLSSKLAPIGTQGGLSAVISEGKRAMTVRVNDVVGVAGFALPGNYVDVMVNALQERDGRFEENRQISKTVLEHVLVLAVAQESSRDDTKPKVVNAVTLELSIDDAEKLDLARNVGTLSLVLRNQIDKEPVITTGITKKQLFGERAATVNAAPMSSKRNSKLVPIVSKESNAPLEDVAPARVIPVEAPARTCVEVVQANTRVLNCF